ncbi:hypothetical protein TNCT_272031 [Trichonephila clavata]|uniref:Uncharacterized protein n=1 Tax=Trichonephila clavata TaxID=2740835 RepID=A0A8X6GXB1_TRICU|nr:hypothetical protein TNCT_272031 [Trichonephila clavata]
MGTYFLSKRKFPSDSEYLNSECYVLVLSAFKDKLYFECPIVHCRKRTRTEAASLSYWAATSTKWREKTYGIEQY